MHEAEKVCCSPRPVESHQGLSKATSFPFVAQAASPGLWTPGLKPVRRYGIFPFPTTIEPKDDNGNLYSSRDTNISLHMISPLIPVLLPDALVHLRRDHRLRDRKLKIELNAGRNIPSPWQAFRIRERKMMLSRNKRYMMLLVIDQDFETSQGLQQIPCPAKDAAGSSECLERVYSASRHFAVCAQLLQSCARCDRPQP